jgi:hypothetical protein
MQDPDLWFFCTGLHVFDTGPCVGFMEYKYVKEGNKLYVYGMNCESDIQTIKKMIQEEKIPNEIDTLIYRRNPDSVVVLLLRGKDLRNILKPTPEAATPAVVKPGSIADRLQKINEANIRQSIYSGVLIYSLETRRFLMFTPRERNNQVHLLGDNPVTNEETPQEICCRSAYNDIRFDDDDHFNIEPKWLLPLKTFQIGGTMYHAHLIVLEREFPVKTTEKYLNAIWVHPEGLKELKLHTSVSALFDKDQKLQQIINQESAIDYDKLVDLILHAPPETEPPSNEN